MPDSLISDLIQPKLKYIFHKLEDFPSNNTKEFFTETMMKGEQIVNSAAMKSKILGNIYPKKTLFGTKWIKGMYGLDISLDDFYKLIMTGNERSRNNGIDYEIDIMVRVKKMEPGVLGSMTPGNPWYNLSEDFLNECYRSNRPHDLFGNNFHEYGHHLGHYHKTRIKSKRRYDPAYTMGRIGRQLFFESLHNNSPLDDDDSNWMNLTCI